jgi:hypothetical protein
MNANDFSAIDAQSELRDLIQISPDEGFVSELLPLELLEDKSEN